MKKIFNVSSKYNTMIIVIVGGVLVAALIGLLLIRPAWNDLQRLGQEIPKEQQARDLKEQDFEHLKQAEVFFKEDPDTVERVNTAVPVSPEVPSMLVMLEALAKQNGVYLTSFSPQQLGASAQSGAGTGSTAPGGGGAAAQEVNPAGTDSVEVTANFRGPYPSLLNFLYNLERSLRITDVKTLTVTSTENGLEGNITIKAYYIQADGGPKTATGPAAGQPAAPTQPQGGAKP